MDAHRPLDRNDLLCTLLMYNRRYSQLQMYDAGWLDGDGLSEMCAEDTHHCL